MITNRANALALMLATALVSTDAIAHAQLQQATPAAGGTVKGSPLELTLRFTEGVEAHFSSVGLSSASGKGIPLGKVTVGGPDGTVVTVKIGRPLEPGNYTVAWRVTSVDSHKTQGTYRFTVKP